MKIVDTHCDALWKMQKFERENRPFSFQHYPLLQVNEERLRKGNIKLQFFAIFVETNVPIEVKWQTALAQIEIFHRHVIEPNPSIIHIKNWVEIDLLQEGEIGAVLAVEGLDIIGNDLTKLRFLRQLGLLSFGLTWNEANLLADGSLEKRGAGLTSFGREVINYFNEHQLLTDISHASDKAAMEMIELATYPIASHSNCRAVCDHPRNISDFTLEMLFQKKGMIHINFYPPFLSNEKGRATIEDIVRHLAHVCEVGGEDYVGFGSDFDGIDQVVKGVANAGMYLCLLEELGNYFTETQIEKFASKNFLKFVERTKARKAMI